MEKTDKQPTQIREPINDDDEVYLCTDCGILRSKNQGGTVFTVCDKCWEKHYCQNKETN